MFMHRTEKNVPLWRESMNGRGHLRGLDVEERTAEQTFNKTPLYDLS
jgi:hypothetical protein